MGLNIYMGRQEGPKDAGQNGQSEEATPQVFKALGRQTCIIIVFWARQNMELFPDIITHVLCPGEVYEVKNCGQDKD